MNALAARGDEGDSKRVAGDRKNLTALATRVTGRRVVWDEAGQGFRFLNRLKRLQSIIPTERNGNANRQKDPAALAAFPGGIDLNTANMGMIVTKDTNGGVKVFTQSKELGLLIERIKQQGVQSAVPVIININVMPVADIRPLLGFNDS